jgi:DNA helicase-2/ATP-dependent DNA helicase PcrA
MRSHRTRPGPDEFMTTHANESIESRLKDSANLLIEAPPGCGKTELLATRASNIVSMLTKGEKILALTFTNRATANLRSRLNKIMGEQAVRRHVQIRNLHGMATEIVMAHGKTLGLDTEKLLLPRTSTLRTAFRRFSTDKDGIDKATKLLAEIKRQPLSDGEVLEQLADSGNSLAIQVETHRQASGQLHFEDLLRHAQRLLRIEAIQHLYSLT